MRSLGLHHFRAQRDCVLLAWHLSYHIFFSSPGAQVKSFCGHILGKIRELCVEHAETCIFVECIVRKGATLVLTSLFHLCLAPVSTGKRCKRQRHRGNFCKQHYLEWSSSEKHASMWTSMQDTWDDAKVPWPVVLNFGCAGARAVRDGDQRISQNT